MNGRGLRSATGSAGLNRLIVVQRAARASTVLDSVDEGFASRAADRHDWRSDRHTRSKDLAEAPYRRRPSPSTRIQWQTGKQESERTSKITSVGSSALHQSMAFTAISPGEPTCLCAPRSHSLFKSYAAFQTVAAQCLRDRYDFRVRAADVGVYSMSAKREGALRAAGKKIAERKRSSQSFFEPESQMRLPVPLTQVQ